MKKKHRKYYGWFFLTAALGLLGVGYLFLSHQKVELQPEQIRQPDQVGDFPSTEEGTLAGTLKEVYFKEQIDPVVVLFASAKIPGLSLLYYPEKKMLVGGSPALVASEVSLFDGQKHSVLYY